jgi:predicted PurR-regulated permease PerM
MLNAEPGKQLHSTIKIDISSHTIAKLLLTSSLCYIILKVSSFILLLALAILIAISLIPLRSKLIDYGLSRAMALTTISLGFIFVFVGLFFFLIPPLASEIGSLSKSLPELRVDIIKNTPTTLGIQRALDQILTASVDTEKMLSRFISLGQYLVESAISILMLLIFTLYFLAEGDRAYRWLLPYFSTKTQQKIALTYQGLLPVISAYMSAQILTSLLTSIFNFLVLQSLGVPAALSLAILSGILNILPYIGFFLSAIPACILAITVSWNTSLLVLLSSIIYNLIENYLIIPKVYGSRMRLSALVILIAIVIASSVAGLVGAVTVLPILASYPIIERIWLARQVGLAVIDEHNAPLDKAV